MKKIILFLALIVGIEINAQVVGGYVTNSTLTNSYVPYSGATKSVNLNTQTFSVTGASTFSNVTVKGTESVTGTSTLNGLTNNGNEITVGTGSIGSTFTVNGAMKASSTLSVQSTTTLNGLQNNGALTATGVVTGGSFVTAGTGSIGSTFTVTGAMKASSTMSLGSANLTGGNTGTVAVLSDAVFAVNLISTGGNPGDGLTYYAGNVGMSLVQTQGAMKVYVPYNSQIVGYTYNIYTNGTLGTTESATVSLLVNGTTSVLVTSAGNFSAAAQTYTASGLSQSISAGDYIESKMVCPTWATNPTDVRMGCTIYFVRRP